MKLPISPLTWMVGCAIIYVIAGLANFVYHFVAFEYIEMVWILVFALPLYVPMRRIVDIGPLWRM